MYADATETLAKFIATGNTIKARDELNWDSSGIHCSSLTNATIHINDNEIQAASGIIVDRHGLDESPGYAEIMRNVIEIYSEDPFDFPTGIRLEASENGGLIEGNECALYGAVGVGITTFQSSNCIVKNNRIRAEGFAFFGITADGNATEPLGWEPEPPEPGEDPMEWFGLTSRNNRIEGNVLEGGPYLYGMYFRDMEDCFCEKNDTSNAFALISQGFLGNSSLNNTFKNNIWGPVDAYGIAGFLVMDVNLFGLEFLGAPALGPVEGNTFTNENFIGDYSGWNTPTPAYLEWHKSTGLDPESWVQICDCDPEEDPPPCNPDDLVCEEPPPAMHLGCMNFVSFWPFFPPHEPVIIQDNEMTALKAGTKLFGFDLCTQIQDSTFHPDGDLYELNNFPGIAKCTKPSPESKEVLMARLKALKDRIPRGQEKK
jgi:hypothetical protein